MITNTLSGDAALSGGFVSLVGSALKRKKSAPFGRKFFFIESTPFRKGLVFVHSQK